MENASDALIIAGSILLLIIALTVSISSFSRVKTQIDDIVISHDQVQYAINSTDNSLLNFIQSKKQYARTVQIESIVTTLRRIRKENYDVYIIFTNTSMPVGLADAIKKELIQNEKYGDIQVNAGKQTIRFSLSGEANKYVEDENNDNFDKALNLLYNSIGDTKFKEYYGIYQEKTVEGVSSANKRDIKIITYVEE